MAKRSCKFGKSKTSGKCLKNRRSDRFSDAARQVMEQGYEKCKQRCKSEWL